jgi:hypothetical protein
MIKIKRPKWSLATQFWAAFLIAALSSAAVFLLSKKDVWSELEIIVSVISVFTFIYFFFLFYYGVRFDRKEIQGTLGTFKELWGRWFPECFPLATFNPDRDVEKAPG